MKATLAFYQGLRAKAADLKGFLSRKRANAPFSFLERRNLRFCYMHANSQLVWHFVCQSPIMRIKSLMGLEPSDSLLLGVFQRKSRKPQLCRSPWC
jgi:hypothetical protein